MGHFDVEMLAEQINRSWEDFPDRKSDSNFIHATKNTAFLFCLSGSLEQSLASVENLRQHPAMRGLIWPR